MKTILIFAVFIKIASSIVIENGVYNGITIGLHQDLLESDCEAIVNSIYEMFLYGKNVLSEAAGLDYGSISIVVPESWSTCGAYSIGKGESYMTYDVSDIRVGNTHPIFGDEPWTSQPRGCGLPGEFISFSATWITTFFGDEFFSNVYYKAKTLVHEWAKFRWGVFEEYGHYGDLVYPESSRKSGSWEVNYCSDTPIQGTFGNCETSSDCHFTIGPAQGARKSLMAITNLSTIDLFCESADHKSDIPTKQNVLCNYKSTWDIINTHPDISQAKSKSDDSGSSDQLNVVVVKENFGVNLVIAYETSKAMSDVVNRYAYETESIAQFITYEAPSTTSLGLVSFDSSYILKTASLRSLSNTSNRIALSKKVIETSLSTKTSDIDLESALRASASLLSDGNGIILLVTKCTGEKPSTTSELAEAADGHPVWIILYPKTSDEYLDVYSQLAFQTGGMLISVEEEVQTISGGEVATPTGRMKLSQAFRQLLHQKPSFDLRQIDYQTCSADEIECSVSFSVNDDFQDPMFVYIYHHSGDILDEVDYKVAPGSCAPDDFGRGEVVTTYALKCSNNGRTPSFTVDVTRKLSATDLIVELVGEPYIKTSNPTVILKGSSNLYNMKYTSTTAPAIYVQVSFNGTSIVYANVYAVVSQNDEITNETSSTIYLRDDGSGADVTGNDGVYSAYLLPALSVGDFSLSVFADNNDGKARFFPTQYTGSSYVCCGSKIPLPSNLDETSSFGINYSGVGTIMESPQNLNLPPGMVTDLRFQNFAGNKSIQFTFTDTGEDLDYGTVDHYMVKIYNTSMSVISEKKVNITAKVAGSKEFFDMTAISCNKAYTVSIYGVDKSSLIGSESNRVTVYIPCDTSSSLSAGAWVGIAIAIIVILGLFIAGLIYGIYYRDKSKYKGKHSKLASCTCCEEGDNDETENRVETTNTELVNTYPVQQITSINDLIRNREQNLNRQNTQAHTEAQEQPDDTYLTRTIGVSETQTLPRDATGGYMSDSFQYSRVKKFGSERSLQSIPSTDHHHHISANSINNVGVPLRTPTSSVGDFNTTLDRRSPTNLYNTAV